MSVASALALGFLAGLVVGVALAFLAVTALAAAMERPGKY